MCTKRFFQSTRRDKNDSSFKVWGSDKSADSNSTKSMKPCRDKRCQNSLKTTRMKNVNNFFIVSQST